MRLFCQEELKEILKGRSIVQTNFSSTKKAGGIRGMHFQKPPQAETKIITCVSGRVWDVAVDIRRNSPTFLQYFAIELSADNSRAVYIPEGFAHGFQALENNSIILYHVTQFYSPKLEAGLRFSDPRLNIAWNLRVTDISAKDNNYPLIDDKFVGI